MDLTLADIGFQAHPEVWLLVAGIAALGFYLWRVVQPKAVAAGYDPISWQQRTWFGLALGSLWIVSDWPVHDVAEEYLYFVHMFQHLFISMLIPAFFLLSTPRWLFELVVPRGSVLHRFLRTGSKPLVAGLTFNAITLFLHWSQIVQWSFESGPLHFALHLVVFVAGLLMWMPIVGPVEEWRLPPVGQCIYLFLMSVVPTVPSGWLIFAEDVVYRHYDTTDRLWGIDVLADQQAAGVVMKLVGGFFLWGVIVVIFARWATAEAEAEKAARRARHAAGGASNLTYEAVAEEFARSEAPAERR